MNRYEVMTRAAEPVEVWADDLKITDSGALVFFLVFAKSTTMEKKDFTRAFARGAWSDVKRVEKENHENQK